MNQQDYQFEVCANGVDSCLAAQEGGAHRVELCASIPEGGTTPSYGEIKVARKILKSTRLHVIIRPRGGDFLYSPIEIERMIEDLHICKELGVDGVVFGCLTEEGLVDEVLCRKLLTHCEGMSTTFHRAFDRCKDPFQALEQIINLGFDRILTSGLQPTAEEGMELLRELQFKAQGRIRLMAGSGVNEENIYRIANETNIKEFHFSARKKVNSLMTFTNPNLHMGSTNNDDSYIEITSEERVRNTILALLEPTT